MLRIDYELSFRTDGLISIRRSDNGRLTPTPQARLFEALEPHGFTLEDCNDVAQQLEENGRANKED